MRNKKPPHHPTKPQKGAFGNKAKSKFWVDWLRQTNYLNKK